MPSFLHMRSSPGWLGEVTTYVCFFDLQKAFDTVQYPLLLRRMFDCGINGKARRLLNSWYTKPKCKIQVNGMLFSTITLERGVLQGSVLSPTLFLMVMDSLLRELEHRSAGPCLRDLYCGAFAHADDIRAISTSRATLDKQISIVESLLHLMPWSLMLENVRWWWCLLQNLLTTLCVQWQVTN